MRMGRIVHPRTHLEKELGAEAKSEGPHSYQGQRGASEGSWAEQDQLRGVSREEPSAGAGGWTGVEGIGWRFRERALDS